MLCVSLVLMLLLTGCATTDASDEVASGTETAAAELPTETPAESESAQPSQEPEVAPEPEPIPEPEPFYCPFCGAEIPEDSVFCHKCGEKIEDFGKEKPWHTPESLDELEGEWQNSELGVTINYPDYSLGTGSRMLSFCWQEQDVTYWWENYSEKNGIAIEEMWRKRNVYRAAILGDIQSDENGSQLGYIVRRGYYGEIYAQRYFFVPEKIVRDNINCFLVSPDGDKIKMQGTFRTFSSMNFTITGTGTVYDKSTYDDWYSGWDDWSSYWGSR